MRFGTFAGIVARSFATNPPVASDGLFAPTTNGLMGATVR